MRKYSWFIALFLLVFCSCHRFWGRHVRGNGNLKTEERTVSSFKDLQVSSTANVYLTQGDLKPVKIEGDENLLPYVEVYQEGDRLVIKNRDGYNLDMNDGSIKIYVTAPQFHHISVSGAGDINGENKITSTDEIEMNLSGAGNIKMNLDAPKITADISGVGSIYLNGQSKDVDLGISGAGSAHCYDLMAENTSVTISGVGSAEVFASVKLDAQVSGAGSVDYKGNASQVNQHVSGVGSVNKKD